MHPSWTAGVPVLERRRRRRRRKNGSCPLHLATDPNAHQNLASFYNFFANQHKCQLPSSRLGSTIMKDEEGILLVIVLQRTTQTCTIKCRQVVGGVREKNKN